MKKQSINTKISDRKTKRKEERKAKKRKHGNINAHNANETTHSISSNADPALMHLKKIHKREKDDQHQTLSKPKTNNSRMKSIKKDDYDVFDPDIAASMRADDEEIAQLEKNLGLVKGSKEKKKLNKEYAKLEGYGDDFGDFLDTLDDMLYNITGKGDKHYDDNVENLEYDSDESDPATARAKYLLRMEAHNRGDEEDGFVMQEDDVLENDSSSDDDEMDEEIIPMKEPTDEHGMAASSNEDFDETDSNEEDDSENYNFIDEFSYQHTPDHREEDTYKPVSGQDLYGNVIDSDQDRTTEPKKYVPPHLRKHALSSSPEDENDPERQEVLKTIQRLLNNNLNRLSEQMLESVSKSIAAIYKNTEYSSRDINNKLMRNMKASCVAPHMIMANLIPLYIACISAVYIQVPDSVQLGAFIIEKLVLDLWKGLKDIRNSLENSKINQEENEEMSNKEVPNLMLMLCYFYNYNVINCRLIYDLVRDLIRNFTEIDVELLLLILSHCGSQLRSDDPSALKDIVSLVQEKSMQIIKTNTIGTESNRSALPSSSRAQFMITAITDLKNNKRQSKDAGIHDKISCYRKILGRIKSMAPSLMGRSTASDSLKIPLQDILDAETKGRWWIVGGTWVGKRHSVDEEDKHVKSNRVIKSESSFLNEKEQKLLKLAAKQRMNTDLRRSIFCIIMGSDDYQDAFEKLVRSEMLRGKSEREVVRVLVHCCGTEKSYNPFYSHLAKRICEHQNKCKFTFQLAFWDNFKQFGDMKARKAANLAKLLAELLKDHILNINVLKVIDISPNDMPETAIIFLTILFSNIFESLVDTSAVNDLFKRGEPSLEHLQKKAEEFEDDNILETSGREALKENIQVFLMHYLQSSPKNTKNSSFRKNLKAAIKACETDSLDYMM